MLTVLLTALVTHIHGIMFSVAAPGKGYGVPFLVASVVLPLLLALSAPAWRVRSAPSNVEHRQRDALLRTRHA
jgi:hypothetical protein